MRQILFTYGRGLLAFNDTAVTQRSYKSAFIYRCLSFIQSHNTHILQVNTTTDFRRLNYTKMESQIHSNSKSKAAGFDLDSFMKRFPQCQDAKFTNF